MFLLCSKLMGLGSQNEYYLKLFTCLILLVFYCSKVQFVTQPLLTSLVRILFITIIIPFYLLEILLNLVLTVVSCVLMVRIVFETWLKNPVHFLILFQCNCWSSQGGLSAEALLIVGAYSSESCKIACTLVYFGIPLWR